MTISIIRAYRINQLLFAVVLQTILPAQTTFLETQVELPTVHYIWPKLMSFSFYQMHSVMLGLVVEKFGFRQLFLILQIVYRLLFLTKASLSPQPKASLSPQP